MVDILGVFGGKDELEADVSGCQLSFRATDSRGKRAYIASVLSKMKMM